MTDNRAGYNVDETVSVQELEDRLFDDLRAHVESMIVWAYVFS